jgi:uncharacterized SAM-binding protein YcdF (DUF218 family)
VNDYYVIFGAAVRPGGGPSGTLKRRVMGAWRLGGDSDATRYLPTGAVGEHGPSEASVMRDVLVSQGVPVDRIVLEERGTDTLSSVVECAKILQPRKDVRSVTVCTSSYHVPRCRLLLRIAGVRSRGARAGGDRSALGLRTWLYYVARELVATPWDTTLLLLQFHAPPTWK